MSNYPPGVTGNEWQIAGFSADVEDAYDEYLIDFEKERRAEHRRQLAEGETGLYVYEVWCDFEDGPLGFGDWLDDQCDW